MTQQGSIIPRAERERVQYDKGLKRSGYQRTLSHTYFYYRRHLASIRRDVVRAAAGQKVLEVGSSVWQSWLEQEGAAPSELHCINISEVELDKGRALGFSARLQPRFHLMDAHKLEFDDASFGLVFGSGILHHLEFERALDEIQRVLKPGGIMLFDEPLDTNPVGWIVRRLTPEARTIDEQPLRLRELRALRRRFDCRFHFAQFLSVPFGVVSRFTFPQPENPLMWAVFQIDRGLEHLLPPLALLYRYVLVVGWKRPPIASGEPG